MHQPSSREVSLAALDALLDGDAALAARHVSSLDAPARAALATASGLLAELAERLPDGDQHVEWAPAFPSLDRVGTPDSEEKVRAMVTAWNAKVSEGHESIPAAVYRRAGGGTWQPAEEEPDA